MKNNAFIKLAASIAFNKLANQRNLHSKIWKTVAKNAPLFALSGGMAGLALENPHAFRTLIDEPAAGFNALLSPITKHLPDSILANNPLKAGTSEAIFRAVKKDGEDAIQHIIDEVDRLKGRDLDIRWSSPDLGELDALGIPANKGKVLDFIGINGSATIPSDNGVDMTWNISDTGLPINTQNLLSNLDSLPRDFSRGAVSGLGLLGGAGLGMSASLPIVDKILQKKQPIAYSLHKNIVSPIKDRYMSLRGLE